MSRVKRGNVARERRKKTLNATKGYRGAQRRIFTIADRAFVKAGKNAYISRRLRRRDFRRLWIVRLNAASRQLGIRYSELIALLKANEVTLDRKQLSELAINDAPAFEALIAQLKR